MILIKQILAPWCRLNCRVFFSTSVLPKEEKIKIGDQVINYLKVGNGPHKLFCAPGVLSTIWMDFKPQIEGFNRDKFSLIIWDPPGMGKSVPPEKNFSEKILDYDVDIAYQFMQALQIPKFSVMGFSFGGIMSLIFAAKYPNVINKLVVCSVNSFVLKSDLEAHKQIKDVNTWSKNICEPFIEVYGKEKFAKSWEQWVDTIEAIYHKNQGNDICSNRLKDIKCPTYILYGEKDPLINPIHALHLRKHIHGSRIHLYPEGKHYIHQRYAEDFNRRVQEFLLE